MLVSEAWDFGIIYIWLGFLSTTMFNTYVGSRASKRLTGSETLVFVHSLLCQMHQCSLPYFWSNFRLTSLIISGQYLEEETRKYKHMSITVWLWKAWGIQSLLHPRGCNSNFWTALLLLCPLSWEWWMIQPILLCPRIKMKYISGNGTWAVIFHLSNCTSILLTS